MEESKKPNLFIIGHPRTGTTALYYFLKQHPDVFVAEEKEPNYFTQEFNRERFIDSKIIDHFTYSLDRYLSLYKNANSEKYLLDATPHNLYSKNAAERIYNFNPEAKIIAIFREPLDFLRSLHSMLVFTSIEKEKSFTEALNKEAYRKKNNESFFLQYSEWIKYADQLKRYQNFFSRKQIMVIIYELFREDNRESFDSIAEFLHIDRRVKINFRIINPNKVVKFGFIKKVMEKPFVWINVKRVKRIIPKFLSNPTFSMYKSLTQKKIPREEYSRETQKDIKKRFYKSVGALDNLLSNEGYIKDTFSLLDFWGYRNLNNKE